MRIPPDLLRKYDRPGPRYTSYPTALELQPGVDGMVYRHHLEQAAQAEEPLSLYLHLPFCEERCLYCGCNVVVTRKRRVAEQYLKHLADEIRSVAWRLGGRRQIRHMHWGGGTPTYLTPSELRWLHGVLRQEFEFEDGAELAIEIDPRVTSEEHLATLRELGFNRLSLGVQDFSPQVQEAVHRVQPFQQTQSQIEFARRLGFSSFNIDLIYGLPYQTPSSFAETLQLVLHLDPDRLAIYSYAHMPWIKVQQRRLPEEALPDAETKLALITRAIECLTDAGYLAIGMDHFAKPDDELGRALVDGTLWRNFMGYTVRQTRDLIGLGASAIGEVGGAYFQNERKLKRYQDGIASGLLAVEKGHVLSADDRLRRQVITSLMCAFQLDVPALEERFEIDFERYFAKELDALEPLQDDGLLEISQDRLEVQGPGRLLVRNIAMCFDAYRRPTAEPAAQPRFSRTI